jgi:hypothetical protein
MHSRAVTRFTFIAVPFSVEINVAPGHSGVVPRGLAGKARGLLRGRLLDRLALVRMSIASLRTVPAVAIALALAACGGGNGSLPVSPGSSTPAQHGHRHNATLHITIKIPKKHKHRGHAARPKFVSPATQSMAIDITGPTNVSEAVALTVASGNCSSTLASTQCTLTIPGLEPGSGYMASVSTYDGPVVSNSGSGNLLSTAQNVAFTITAGSSNTINLSLDGVPATTVVTAIDPSFSPNTAGTFSLVGLGAHRFLVESLDADNNPIVGPGMPSYTFGTPSGLGITVGPSAAGSNIFTISPPATYATGTGSFSITPTFTGQQTDGCAQSGANCNPVTVTAGMTQMLAISTIQNETVSLYADNTTPPTLVATISGLNSPDGTAMDAKGDLFVANAGAAFSGGSGNGSVQEFAPPYSGAPVALSGTGLFPFTLTFDSNNNLFVQEYQDALEYGPPYNAAPSASLAGVSSGEDVTVDASNNVYIAGLSGGVSVYDAPVSGFSTQPTYTVTNGVNGATVVAVNGSTLFVANDFGKTITTYSLPITSFSSNPVFTSEQLSSQALLSMAVDPSGNIFAGACGTGCESAGTVYEFSPPYTTTPTASTTSGVGANPYGLSLDAAGNLFLANCGDSCGTSRALEYAAPFGNGITAQTLPGLGGVFSRVFP